MSVDAPEKNEYPRASSKYSSHETSVLISNGKISVQLILKGLQKYNLNKDSIK